MPNAKIVAPPSPSAAAVTKAEKVRTDAAAATTVPQLRDQVTALAQLVEDLAREVRGR